MKIPKNKNSKGSNFREMGYAILDPDRSERTGIPEAVFAKGKKSEEVAEIMKTLGAESKEPVIATKASYEDFTHVKKELPNAVYHKDAQLIVLNGQQQDLEDGKETLDKESIYDVAVVTGGTSDIPIAEEGAITLEALGIEVKRFYDVGVAAIERILSKVEDIKKAKVIIVVAGMEGALASVMGGLVTAPIIAVPTSVGYGANFEGMAALLSMLNSCAPGVSIVNIDNGFGAACSAIKILKVAD